MLEEVAKDAWEYGRKFLLQGKVADYIPELGKANPVHFGLCIKTEDGRHIEFGDSECRFTIQSICKIVSLAAALQYIGEEKVFKNVMMEPSGDAFNSILKLDTASNRPFNPMINAGAIEVVSLLAGRFSFEKMLEFIRTLCNDNEIVLDESVYRSEKATGDRNRAIGYLLKSKGVLKGDVLQTLDLYFKLCSLSVNAQIIIRIRSSSCKRRYFHHYRKTPSRQKSRPNIKNPYADLRHVRPFRRICRSCGNPIQKRCRRRNPVLRGRPYGNWNLWTGT